MGDDNIIASVESWEAPPKFSDRSYDWDAIAAQLRDRPMQWAKIAEQERTSVINAVRQGSIRVLHPQLGFEVRTANNIRKPVRIATLYMRYNPDRDTGALRSTLDKAREEQP